MNPTEEYRRCWVESNEASDQYHSELSHDEAKRFISRCNHRMRELEQEHPELSEEFHKVFLECQKRGVRQ